MKKPLALPLLLLLSAPAGQAWERTVPAESIAETRELLGKLVAIDTSNPPGNELALVRFVEPILKAEGLEVRVFESTSGRGNLWAKLKGEGLGRPLFITAHTDVVGAVGEGWKSDPFSMVEREGHLYGRGVLDDKGMGATAITVLKLLARRKIPLKRDVVLFLGADEESGGDFGMDWMIAHHPELIEAEAVLNEGGGIGIEGDAFTQAAVQVYEKLYMDAVLSVEGESGHSSIPTRDNAVVRLARAVARIGEFEFPVRLNPVTREYFRGLSGLKEHPLRESFAAIASDGEGFQRAAAELSKHPFYNAQLRTTCAPTLMAAGFRANAIPGKVSATVNCRILPDADHQEVLAELRRVVDDPRVAISGEKPSDPAMTPFDDPFFHAIRRVLGELAPGAAAVPFMSAGATDSAKLRRRGLKAYGLVPAPITAEDKGRMHGDNERIRVSSLEFGVEFLYRLVTAYAGS